MASMDLMASLILEKECRLNFDSGLPEGMASMDLMASLILEKECGVNFGSGLPEGMVSMDLMASRIPKERFGSSLLLQRATGEMPSWSGRRSMTESMALWL